MVRWSWSSNVLLICGACHTRDVLVPNKVSREKLLCLADHIKCIIIIMYTTHIIGHMKRRRRQIKVDNVRFWYFTFHEFSYLLTLLGNFGSLLLEKGIKGNYCKNTRTPTFPRNLSLLRTSLFLCFILPLNNSGSLLSLYSMVSWTHEKRDKYGFMEKDSWLVSLKR